MNFVDRCVLLHKLALFLSVFQLSLEAMQVAFGLFFLLLCFGFGVVFWVLLLIVVLVFFKLSHKQGFCGLRTKPLHVWRPMKY